VLSRRQRGPALAALLLAVCLPAAAQGPVASVCSELRNDIDYYYGLWAEGGSPKQMTVWRRIYLRNIWKYGNAQCPKYDPRARKRGRARMNDDANPVRNTQPVPEDDDKRQQAAL